MVPMPRPRGFDNGGVMSRTISSVIGSVALAASLILAGPADANPSILKNFNFNHLIFQHPHPFATSHLVIQVSQNDPAVWSLALGNAQNALKLLGNDRVQIVIVAYGPGLHMLLANTPVAARINTLDQSGVEFDACNNTLQAMARALGHVPALVPQATIVPAGIVRIMQLESHGFNYVKP
jgi:intracellular sulfur oxidation DsrE/DsrF family protein